MKSIPRISRWKTALRSFQLVKNAIPVLNEYLAEKGNTVQVFLGGIHPMILTIDPEFAQHILQKNHKAYKKSEVHFERIKHFLGQGLLTSEGQYWLQQRRLIQPGFHRKKLEEILELMNRVVDAFLDELDREISSQKVVDIYEKMQHLTFKVIANSTFSSNLEDDELQRISYGLTTLQAFIIKQIRQPFLNTWLKWSGQVEKHEILRDEGSAIIQRQIDKRRTSNQSFSDLLQMLLDARYEDTGESMSDQQLIDETKILFIAGHDTSANALAWTWYLLATHPEVLEKVKAEIKEKIPDKHISFEQINSLEYTQQVLNESMRMFPPAWTTNRVAAEADEFNGLPIKEGTVFATYIYGIHHSKDLWDDPELFNPDRFSNSSNQPRHPFGFIPFGGGPRLCIGNQFAMMEMKLTLAKMVNRYNMNLVEHQKIELYPLITLRPKNGIKMKVDKINSN